MVDIKNSGTILFICFSTADGLNLIFTTLKSKMNFESIHYTALSIQ